MLQISSTLIKTNNELEQEFEDSFFKYAQKDGYYKHKDYYELPRWVAECTYTLKNSFELEFKIITIDNFNKIPNLNRYDYILFSVMDCNKHIIKRFIEQNMFCSTKTKFIMGGYTIIEDDTFQGIHQYVNISNVDSIETMCKLLGVDYYYGLDYSLFNNEPTIPRLQLSKNCNFHCSFCTIDKGVVSLSHSQIINQCNGINKLNHKLIYIDDKTFFQDKKWNENLTLADYQLHHSNFHDHYCGYIIQTSPKYLVHENIKNVFMNTNIKFVEIGLESYNDFILQKYNKPFNIRTFNKAFSNVVNSCAKPILNIIIGNPDETDKSYFNTYQFLKKYINEIYTINYTYYTNYKDENNDGQQGINLRPIDIKFRDEVLELFINKFNHD